MCCLCCYCYFVLADCSRLIAGDLQRVGLQGPDKEAPTSHRIPRINNKLSWPTEGVRFCLSRSASSLYRETLFGLNSKYRLNFRKEFELRVYRQCRRNSQKAF